MWLYDSSIELSFIHPVACELSWQLCCFGQPACESGSSIGEVLYLISLGVRGVIEGP